MGRFLHSSGPKKDRGPLQIGTRSPFTSSNPSYSAAISASSNLSKCIGKIAVSASSQQQQSQASWDRLEIKPKRHKGHGSGTLIASLEALLSKATSLEIFQSLKSLLTNLSQVSLGLPLPPLHYRHILEPHYAPAPQEQIKINP